MTRRSPHRHTAVLYLHVNSQQNSYLPSPFEQLEACQRIAAKYGLTIVREYVDHGETVQLSHQAGLRQLLDDLTRQQDAACVLVWHNGHLARDEAQAQAVLNVIHQAGADVVSVTDIEAAEQLAKGHAVTA